MQLRVGIIGAGQAGERHAAGFAAATGARIIGVADLMNERAVKLARRFDAAPHTHWQTLLEDDLDLVVVSLPHSLHVEPAEAAAAQGIHVLMEKPIATTLEDARRIIDACKVGKVKLTISFVHRFREELQLAHRWLAKGQVGNPQIAREVMSVRRSEHLPAWLTRKDIAGGGVLMYSAIHGVDRLRWLLDSEVTSVTAQTRTYTPHAEVEDGVAALLRFANGATATLTANAPLYRAEPTFWETEIYGDAGMLRLRTRQWAELSNDDIKEHIDAPEKREGTLPHYNFTRQAQAFVDAINNDHEPPITGEDGLKALDIVLTIYRSAETGNPVHLNP